MSVIDYCRRVKMNRAQRFWMASHGVAYDKHYRGDIVDLYSDQNGDDMSRMPQLDD